MSETPGALAAITGGASKTARPTFDADQRSADRQASVIKIGGTDFRRRKKVWDVNLGVRTIQRVQQRELSLQARTFNRVAELEVEQLEAASKGDTDKDADLEGQIEHLTTKADEAVARAERATYALVALLLVPPDDFEVKGWGPLEGDHEHEREEALEFLRAELDVDDAADMIGELNGGTQDPPQTPTSGTGSG